MAKVDLRRFVVYQVSIVDGELVEGYAGSLSQDLEGIVTMSGLWDSILPMSPEDVRVQANELGVSSLEWLKSRLQQSSLIRVEVVQ